MNSINLSLVSGIKLLLVFTLILGGCFRYSFTGISIPPNVRTIYIPFFSDQSGSGMGDLSDQLNDALVNRFVNQSRLQLSGTAEDADVILEGRITGYSNRPYTVGGDERAELNEVRINVQSSFRYANEDVPEWDKNFSGSFQYDPNVDPAAGEVSAALEALNRIADNMFNDALGDW